jgi:hypothetical protein
MNDKLIKKMVESIFAAMNEQKVVEFKDKPDVILQRAMALIREDLAREAALDAEVNRMMDDLERQNPGAFQRFKMFPLLKKRLAKEKGIIL